MLGFFYFLGGGGVRKSQAKPTFSRQHFNNLFSRYNENKWTRIRLWSVFLWGGGIGWPDKTRGKIFDRFADAASESDLQIEIDRGNTFFSQSTYRGSESWAARGPVYFPILDFWNVFEPQKPPNHKGCTLIPPTIPVKQSWKFIFEGGKSTQEKLSSDQNPGYLFIGANTTQLYGEYSRSLEGSCS